MAPTSDDIEKIATGVPPRAPAASPTEAAGAVPRNAADTPYTQSTPMRTAMFEAKATARIDPAASSVPSTIAGRRPTVATNRPAGPTANVWTTAAQVNAIPVQEVPRCSTSTTRTGTSAERTPNDDQP